MMDDLPREIESKTKKQAIISIISMYLNLKRREKLISLIGNYDFSYTDGDLERMRADGPPLQSNSS